MPFLLIQGHFLPRRGQPDGDSVRFTPQNPALFQTLEQKAGRRLKSSTDAAGRVSVQLRYEGIDALEKDALPPLPKQALEANLKLLGYRQGIVDEPPGYILASGIEKNGRPVVFVFSGNPAPADGSTVFLDKPLLKKSVNYKQILAGQVYPMYYMSLYAELRNELTAAAVAARSGPTKRGVWAADKSRAGFPFRTGAAVRTLDPIFPKLYRRLQKSPAATADDFLDELDRQNERLLILSDGRFVHFNDVVAKVSTNKLKLTHAPEDLVFQEG